MKTPGSRLTAVLLALLAFVAFFECKRPFGGCFVLLLLPVAMAVGLEVHVPPLHAGQLEVAQDPHRFRVVCAGRRWGKSRLAAILSVLEGLAGKRAWWVAPSYPMAETAWRELKDLASQAGAEIRESDRALIFPRGGFVRVKSSDKPNSLRGEGLDFVVMDEASFQSEETWTNELRPALADRLGKALFISTPAGRDFFSRLFSRGQDPDESEWKSWRFETASNPFIAPAEIAQAERDMPARRFEQEFLASFTDDAGGVFRSIRSCATAEPLERAQAGRTYCIGVDWGRSVDFTVMAVFDARSGEMVALDRSNRVEYQTQRDRLRALCDRFRPTVVLAEENSIGAPIIEQLVREQIPVKPFVTSNSSKAEIVDALALAFERNSIRILPDPVLIGELEAFEMTRLPSGLMRYAAPGGMHDDTVIATALAWWAVSGGGQDLAFLEFLQGELERKHPPETPIQEPAGLAPEDDPRVLRACKYDATPHRHDPYGPCLDENGMQRPGPRDGWRGPALAALEASADVPLPIGARVAWDSMVNRAMTGTRWDGEPPRSRPADLTDSAALIARLRAAVSR